MPSIRRVARSSALEMSASRPSRRVRTLLFFSRMCERKALRRRKRPVPVTLMRLAAPRSVFIFGIASSLFGGGGRRGGGRSVCVLCVGDGLRARRGLLAHGSFGGLVTAMLVGCPRRGGLTGPLVGSQHHDHVAIVELGLGLDFGDAFHLLGNAI